MTCDQSVLRGSGLVSESHMTVDIEAVIFLSVDSGPDTGVTTPHNISESDQVILGGEDCVDLVAFSDLVIIEFLKIFAHSHGANGVAWIETIQVVASGIGGKEVASGETPSGTSNTDKSVYLVSKRGSEVERSGSGIHFTSLDDSSAEGNSH